MPQADRASESESECLRRARAPADAPATAPSRASFLVIDCSRESGDQLLACSTPGCCRPRRYWRIHRETFSGEQVCCPDCMVPPAGTTATSGEHAHSVECNAREAVRRQQQPSAPLPTPTPPPAPAACAPAATPAPAPPSAPTPAQVRESAWVAIREGPPPLTLPYTSEQWLVRHQQWMLRQRRQHPEVGERYSWECTVDGPADDAPPPRPRMAIEVTDCKSTSTTSALHRFPNSSPRTEDDGEPTEKEMEAAGADAVVRYSKMHVASIQSDRRRLLAVTEDHG